MRILQMGSCGPAVSLLQLGLNRALGAALETDGVFGPATADALRNFQRREGLVPDGVAGRETHRAILPYYTGCRLHRVARGDTLWLLAQRFGSTVDAIRTANPGVQAENLTVGEVLVIPLDFPVVPTTIPMFSALAGYCVRGLSMRYPFLISGEIGRSVMGRPLWRLTLGEGENRVFYHATHHANEWICTPLLLRFAEELAAAYASGGGILGRSAAGILRHARITLIPAVNPDGMDLVTGELTRGAFYRAAEAVARDYPRVPFPSGWKANIRGTDLNLQYPAGWEQARENKAALGVTSPAPMNYVGPAPLSAPESRAVYDYTLAFAPRLTLSFHTQGEVIYWRYLDREPPGAREIGERFARLSGYALEDVPFASSFAGYKDWFIEAFDRPGYTIEAGRGTNPLPLSDFEEIWRACLPILVEGALST